MKKFVTAIFAIGIMFCMAGCNRQLIDTTYNYISLPNGECLEGSVQSWTDYSDGDQIQVKIDGVTYLTDTTRVVLTTK